MYFPANTSNNATRARTILAYVKWNLKEGWNDVGFHGSDQIPTPNIDALAYSGVILNRHYTLPTCTPSRTAFLTGRYPIRSGMQGYPLRAGEPRGIPLSEVLLPERLRELGYVTRLVGKWHVGSHKTCYLPTRRGFLSHLGHWYGYMGYHDHNLQQNTGSKFISGADLHRDLATAWDLQGQYATHLYTREAQHIIATHNLSRPLYLQLAHLAVHSGNDTLLLEVPDVHANDEQFSHIQDTSRRRYAGGNVSHLGVIDGVNQWPTLSQSGEVAPLRDEVLVNMDTATNMEGIIRGRWKLMRGSYKEGIYDQHYGESGRQESSLRYDVEAVLQSAVATQISSLQLDSWSMDWDVVSRLRAEAAVTCEPYPTASAGPVCNTTCLFNLGQDPCEVNNIASTEPQTVAALEERLSWFRSLMVPQLNQPLDLNSDPELHNGSWVPWLDDEQA